MDRFEFTVPGPPVPKGRPRHGGRTYTPARTREAEDVVAIYAMRARGKFLEGHLRVEIAFHVSRFRGDGDNLEKLVLDALKSAGVLRDDRQVHECRWTIEDASNASAECTVVRLSRITSS